jgi:hypothetical protein
MLPVISNEGHECPSSLMDTKEPGHNSLAQAEMKLQAGASKRNLLPDIKERPSA